MDEMKKPFIWNDRCFNGEFVNICQISQSHDEKKQILSKLHFPNDINQWIIIIFFNTTNYI
jgi:hypothetical protein